MFSTGRAFDRKFNTGQIEHYPKHLPRSNDPDYFEDMSAWAGDSLMARGTFTSNSREWPALQRSSASSSLRTYWNLR